MFDCCTESRVQQKNLPLLLPLRNNAQIGTGAALSAANLSALHRYTRLQETLSRKVERQTKQRSQTERISFSFALIMESISFVSSSVSFWILSISCF